MLVNTCIGKVTKCHWINKDTVSEVQRTNLQEDRHVLEIHPAQRDHR